MQDIHQIINQPSNDKHPNQSSVLQLSVATSRAIYWLSAQYALLHKQVPEGKLYIKRESSFLFI